MDIIYQLPNYPTNYLTGTHPKTQIIHILQFFIGQTAPGRNT